MRAQVLAIVDAYERMGVKVFPLRINKHPFGKWGEVADETSASRREGFEKALADRIPFLIGGLPGHQFVVLDIDDADLLREEVRRDSLDFDAPTVLTPSGGRQVWFRNECGLRPKAYPWGEVRTGNGMLVILPGSPYHAIYVKRGRNINAPYAWADEARPLHLCALPTMPLWFRDFLLAQTGAARGEASSPVTAGGEPIPEGQRNSTLASLAGTMRCRGMGDGAIRAALLAENQKRCMPPLPEEEVARIAASVGKYAAGDHKDASPRDREIPLAQKGSVRWQPVGAKGIAILTVKVGGSTVAADKVDMAKAEKRDGFAERLCTLRPELSREEVDAALLAIATACLEEIARGEGARVGEDSGEATPAELLQKMPEAVRREAEALLHSPTLVREIVEDIAALGVVGEASGSLTMYLAGTSRLLQRPLVIIIAGGSSTGKSWIQQRVGGLFPPEAVISATHMTPQSLYYGKPGFLKHRLLLAGERSQLRGDDAAEATRAVRQLISEGRISKLVPMKIDDEMQTILVEQEGPVAYVETTTQARIFAEDLNRAIMLGTDEQEEQTRRILQRSAGRYALNPTGVDAESIVEKHWAAQRMLASCVVCIPYQDLLAEEFPAHRVEARRAFSHLLSTIETIALLHQFQRARTSDKRLIATNGDYALALNLLTAPLGRALGLRMSDAAARCFPRVQAWASTRPCAGFQTPGFTVKELARHLSVCDRTVSGYVTEWDDAGLLTLRDAARGRKAAIWALAPDAAPAVRSLKLPAPQDIWNRYGV